MDLSQFANQNVYNDQRTKGEVLPWISTGYTGTGQIFAVSPRG